MIVISSLCLPLNTRLKEIDAELATCTDEARLKDLKAEREIKGDLQSRLLAAAYEVPRKGKARK